MVFEGPHIRPLPTRLEVVTADEQADQDWQLIDPGAILRPCTKQIGQIDADLTEALEDDQA
jgi:hypothetical protein